MESKSDDSIGTTPHFPNITNLNVKITPKVFNSGGNRCGGHSGGRGPPGVGRGYGWQPNTDHDKLYYTQCGRYHHAGETCWGLNGKPQNVPATPVEMEHPNDTTEQETSNQHWKDALSVLRQSSAALEGVTSNSSVGMTSSHNPVTFASSASSSTWVIDSRATDHVIVYLGSLNETGTELF
eukprot:TRINITY_DN13593_c0_g2_i1.p1 TRINITY_DN13593_c0_g2~~TRINITY_DN13593_c0_g2_i1.p1  ORF type:complete len:181 (-),score=26.77 TRINITY_DN13593_c0_g2_i1:243-785(-)